MTGLLPRSCSKAGSAGHACEDEGLCNTQDLQSSISGLRSYPQLLWGDILDNLYVLLHVPLMGLQQHGAGIPAEQLEELCLQADPCLCIRNPQRCIGCQDTQGDWRTQASWLTRPHVPMAMLALQWEGTRPEMQILTGGPDSWSLTVRDGRAAGTCDSCTAWSGGP